jgi:hypothetical protein
VRSLQEPFSKTAVEARSSDLDFCAGFAAEDELLRLPPQLFSAKYVEEAVCVQRGLRHYEARFKHAALRPRRRRDAAAQRQASLRRPRAVARHTAAGRLRGPSVLELLCQLLVLWLLLSNMELDHGGHGPLADSVHRGVSISGRLLSCCCCARVLPCPLGVCPHYLQVGVHAWRPVGKWYSS